MNRLMTATITADQLEHAQKLLRQLADSLADPLVLSVRDRLEPVTRPEFADVVIDNTFEGRTIVIHVGNVNDRWLLGELQKENHGAA